MIALEGDVFDVSLFLLAIWNGSRRQLRVFGSAFEQFVLAAATNAAATAEAALQMERPLTSDVDICTISQASTLPQLFGISRMMEANDWRTPSVVLCYFLAKKFGTIFAGGSVGGNSD